MDDGIVDFDAGRIAVDDDAADFLFESAEDLRRVGISGASRGSCR
jgi:hypothetical protein